MKFQKLFLVVALSVLSQLTYAEESKPTYLKLSADLEVPPYEETKKVGHGITLYFKPRAEYPIIRAGRKLKVESIEQENTTAKVLVQKAYWSEYYPDCKIVPLTCDQPRTIYHEAIYKKVIQTKTVILISEDESIHKIVIPGELKTRSSLKQALNTANIDLNS